MEEAHVRYHSGSVEDGNVNISPGSRKSNKVRRCYKAARTPLLILVNLALFGLTIEAYFINRLYHLISTQTSNTTSGPNLNLSCKPFAVLQDVDYHRDTMQWRDYQGCGMDYKDGRLLVQKEGFYYVYSMVSFLNSGRFQHSIKILSPYYPKDITLIESKKYSQNTDEVDDVSSSYVGGVFNLCKGCYIFVKMTKAIKVTNVTNVTNVTYIKSPDHHFFGAFMI